MDVVGIDNDMRGAMFGREASTEWRISELKSAYSRFKNHREDIRNSEFLEIVFRDIGKDLLLIVHAAAQTSHDWASSQPRTDFGVNAVGTLNMLEATRQFAPQAVFAFLSTNKVYGDAVNLLPLIELETRWEIHANHPYSERGVDESMTLDQSTHSLFGASKLSADILVQEYGRCFQLKTACFRPGCVTGGSQSGAELHGFLAYLMKCTVTGRAYTVFGYNGKQVRDNIHSRDLVRAIWFFAQAPRSAAVYNIGGGRSCNCSMLEAIELCEEIAGRSLDWSCADQHRAGDHIWWISDCSRFRKEFPAWRPTYDLRTSLEEICERGRVRWLRGDD
jgi:CDP-paratose 2-epimerase